MRLEFLIPDLRLHHYGLDTSYIFNKSAGLFCTCSLPTPPTWHILTCHLFLTITTLIHTNTQGRKDISAGCKGVGHPLLPGDCAVWHSNHTR